MPTLEELKAQRQQFYGTTAQGYQGTQRPLQSAGEVFRRSLIQGATLGYSGGGVDPTSAYVHPVASGAGQLVGGIAPVAIAAGTGGATGAATGIGRTAGTILGGAALGGARPAQNEYERARNISNEALMFGLFEGAPLVRQAGATGLRAAGLEAGIIGAGATGLEAATGTPLPEALQSAAIMAGAHGVTAGGRALANRRLQQNVPAPAEQVVASEQSIVPENRRLMPAQLEPVKITERPTFEAGAEGTRRIPSQYAQVSEEPVRITRENRPPTMSEFRLEQPIQERVVNAPERAVRQDQIREARPQAIQEAEAPRPAERPQAVETPEQRLAELRRPYAEQIGEQVQEPSLEQAQVRQPVSDLAEQIRTAQREVSALEQRIPRLRGEERSSAERDLSYRQQEVRSLQRAFEQERLSPRTSREGSVTIPEGVRTPREMVDYIRSEGRRAADTFRRLPGEIRNEFTRMKISAERFWNYAQKYVTDGLQKATQQFRDLIGRAVSWVQENFGQIFRSEGTGARRFREGSFSTEEAGIGQGSQIHRQVRDAFRRTGRIENYKQILQDRFGKEQMRDLTKQEARQMLNELQGNTVSGQKRNSKYRAEVPPREVPRAAEQELRQTENRFARAGKDALRTYENVLGWPARRLGRTQAGRKLVEQLALAKTYGRKLRGETLTAWDDAIREAGPKPFETSFMQWFRSKQWARFVESGGKDTTGLPQQYLQRANTLRTAWKDKVAEVIARDAEAQGLEGFQRIKGKDYYPHAFTSQAMEALRAESGELYRAIVDAAGGIGLSGESWRNLRRGIVERKFGSLEEPRLLDLPETVTVNGREVTIREYDPFKVIPKHINNATRRLGITKIFGQGELRERAGDLIRQHGQDVQRRTGGGFDNETKFAERVLEQFQGFQTEGSFTGRLPAAMRSTIALIRSGQLSLAAIPNATLGWVPIASRFGVRNTMRGMIEAMQGSDRVAKLQKWDAWHRDAMFEMFDIADLEGAAGRVGRKWLTLTGFNGINRYLNKITGLAAVDHFEAAARRGDARALDVLVKDFHFNADRVARIRESRALTDADRIQIVQQAPAITNVTGESVLERQPWLDTRFARYTLAYTSYIRQLGETSWRAIDQAKQGNYAPLATYIFGSAAGGEAAIWLKNWMKGKEREDDSIWGRLWFDLMYAGALGPVGEIAQRAESTVRFREPIQVQVGGPFLDALNDMWQDIAVPPLTGNEPRVQRFVDRTIPVVPVARRITELAD